MSRERPRYATKDKAYHTGQVDDAISTFSATRTASRQPCGRTHGNHIGGDDENLMEEMDKDTRELLGCHEEVKLTAIIKILTNGVDNRTATRQGRSSTQ